jgi:hypothetical protein
MAKADHLQGTRPLQTDSDVGKAKLPHERDEAAHANTKDAKPGQKNIVERARQDVESGQVDTDCRNVPGSPHCPTQEKQPR